MGSEWCHNILLYRRTDIIRMITASCFRIIDGVMLFQWLLSINKVGLIKKFPTVLFNFNLRANNLWRLDLNICILVQDA